VVKRKRHPAVSALIAVGILTVVVANVLPLFWGLLSSFKPFAQLVTYPPTLFDFTPTLDNYRTVFDGGFMTGVRNSAVYALVAVALGLACGSFAAFGLDRFSFVGQATLFLVIVASIPLAIGAAALLVPKYVYFTTLGLTNHWYTLPLIYAVHSLPITIWIIKGSMESIPRELDEAAYVDGASTFMVLRRIVLPLCKPAIGAAGLFLFIHAWNEFVAGSVMVDAKELKPIQPLLYQYIGFFGREWGPLTAAATIAVIPIFVIYALFGRLLISGLTRGATKG
jgi:ABC-type glycerol-3-phosphate transport system permease component